MKPMRFADTKFE